MAGSKAAVANAKKISAVPAWVWIAAALLAVLAYAMHKRRQAAESNENTAMVMELNREMFRAAQRQRVVRARRAGRGKRARRRY